ncbi:hypothetical protein DFH07DRAFT_968685 [Mycena maculata]|uniref:F-box domain-containing protein n=1 Tax=Mycena maculata TaxID=230809 RepID=A0AAD7MT90_9AGAR|nr:hypothetical protein DFH07DRAFT_968685 [Mycena maculata]
MNRPRSARSYTPRAPAELWRLVFWHATASPTAFDVGYVPFEPLDEMRETMVYLECEALRLRTCLSLTRVCRLWRLIEAEFLYEDVRIADTRTLKSLVRALKRSEEDGLGGFGRYIRRLELPMRTTNFTSSSSELSPFPLPPLRTPSPAFNLGDLLRYMPRLEILVRPCLRLDMQAVYFWASLIATPLEILLPNLRRLEWHETDLDTRFYGNRNTARLAELIAHSPRLQYLFLSSDRPEILARLPPCRSLRTLRLNRSHFQSHHVKNIRTPELSFPHLTHLVLQTTMPSSLLAFLSVVGPHLRVLELAFAPQFVFSTNQMQRILSRCPAVEDMAFYVGAPEISALTAFTHPALRRVHLKFNPEEWYPYKHILKSQFAVLEGPSFPRLEEIVLHDSTRSLGHLQDEWNSRDTDRSSNFGVVMPVTIVGIVSPRGWGYMDIEGTLPRGSRRTVRTLIEQ